MRSILTIDSRKVKVPPSHRTVLVIYSGGTIGMQKIDGAYQPASNVLVQLLKRESIVNDPRLAESATISTDLPVSKGSCSWITRVVFALPATGLDYLIFYLVLQYPELVDSSSMSMDGWCQIAQDIETYHDFFDGFVVLHGTDTMAFTASALSFMLESMSKQVVLTGSMVPMCERGSDGWSNILGALVAACEPRHSAGVTLFFDNMLFRGCRVVKTSSRNKRSFDSPNFPPVAKFENGEIVRLSNATQSHLTNGLRPTVHIELCKDIAVVTMFPSISISHFSTALSPPIKGVVLLTFGLGNFPSSRNDLLDELHKARKQGIIVVNVTQCLHGGTASIYATGKILQKYGVISGQDLTMEAAIAKLACILGRRDLVAEKDSPEAVYAKRKHLMETCLCGEMTTVLEEPV